MNNIYEDKKRFNIVDAIIILGILVIAASLFFRTQIIMFFGSQTTKDEYVISFEAEYVDNTLVPLIGKGSEVTWLENNVSIGTLDTVSTPVKATIYETDSDGNIHIEDSKTHSKIVGKLSVSAITNNGCYIDGAHFIGAGMTVTLSTKNAQFTAVITAVELE